MIPVETLGVFFGASLALAVAPGPDNLFVLTQSALHGRAAGLYVTLGLCTGLIAHTCAVAIGVGSFLQRSDLAYNLLRFLGGAYLIYLAWRMLRASLRRAHAPREPNLQRRQLYLRGVIMNVTNPKVTLFFLAFLPQFTDPHRGSLILQFLVLGALFMAATILVFGSIACTAGYLSERWNRSSRWQRTANWIAGAIFLALALRLAVTAR